VRDTIGIYLDSFRLHKNAAVTLQANLGRTREDLLGILRKGGKVRLVKGAYRGDYREREEIAANFSRLMRILFSRGNNFAIATNDEELLEEAKILQLRYRKDFEFQFLRGVKKKLKLELAEEFSVSDYTPFGTDCLPYLWRRVREQGISVLFSMFR
jgi:proline dehydrogenase